MTRESIVLGAASLADEEYFQEKKQMVVATRERTKEELRRRGFEVLDSSANFLFAKPNSVDAGWLFEELKKDYVSGVTFSGGEPTLQAKALIPLFQRLKEQNIHICIDTNGSIWNEEVEELLKWTDLVLLDIKEFNNVRHRQLTERSNEQTIRTAEWLEKNGKPFWLRYVLVPGYSSFEEDIRALGEHFKNYHMIQRVEILPYHTLGIHKYEAMGKEYKLNGIKENTLEQLETAKTLFGEYFNTVYLN